MSYETLTIKQQRFAEILFNMPNPIQAQAYMQAGYKCVGKTAAEHGSRLAKNGKVKAYLEKLRAKATEKAEIDGAKVVKEIAGIAFEKAKDKVTVAHKLDALEKLSKHLGLYEKDKENKLQVQVVPVFRTVEEERSYLERRKLFLGELESAGTAIAE